MSNAASISQSRPKEDGARWGQLTGLIGRLEERHQSRGASRQAEWKALAEAINSGDNKLKEAIQWSKLGDAIHQLRSMLEIIPLHTIPRT